MDQKVLAALIDHKTFNTLTNNSLDVKTIQENEISEVLRPQKTNLLSLKTEQESLISLEKAKTKKNEKNREKHEFIDRKNEQLDK